jgi:hypothetical protein
LSAEDVTSVIEQSSDVDDVTIANFLSALYSNDLIGALTVIPNISDFFKAVNGILNTNYFLMVTAALAGKRHPKVWSSKAATLVSKINPMEGLKASQRMAILVTVNEQAVALKTQASSFLVPEMPLLSSFASRTIQALQPIFRTTK